MSEAILTITISFLFIPNLYAQSIQQTKSLAELARNVDWSCLHLRVTGPCSDPAPGVYIRYWEPAVVMETVKAPGEFVIREFSPILSLWRPKQAADTEMRTATGLSNVAVTSSNSWQSLGGSNLQFHEVHLYDFPTKLIEEAALCPSIPNVTGGVRFLSEEDSMEWRMARSEKNSVQTQTSARTKIGQIGKWGLLYPRTGFLIQSSPAVGSALDALRAISITTDWVSSWNHAVKSRLDFPMDPRDQMQMVYPAKTMCMEPGRDAGLWERGKTSRDGRYVWVYWHYRECCKPIIPPP